MEFELELSAETVLRCILTFVDINNDNENVRKGKEWLDETRVDEQSGTIKNSTTKALTQSFDNQNTRKKFWILNKFELWICKRWCKAGTDDPILFLDQFQLPQEVLGSVEERLNTNQVPNTEAATSCDILLTHRGHCPHIIIVCLQLLTVNAPFLISSSRPSLPLNMILCPLKQENINLWGQTCWSFWFCCWTLLTSFVCWKCQFCVGLVWTSALGAWVRCAFGKVFIAGPPKYQKLIYGG